MPVSYRVAQWRTVIRLTDLVFSESASRGLDIKPFSKGLDSGCVVSVLWIDPFRFFARAIPLTSDHRCLHPDSTASS
jgi:hypothetical protein